MSRSFHVTLCVFLIGCAGSGASRPTTPPDPDVQLATLRPATWPVILDDGTLRIAMDTGDVRRDASRGVYWLRLHFQLLRQPDMGTDPVHAMDWQRGVRRWVRRVEVDCEVERAPDDTLATVAWRRDLRADYDAAGAVVRHTGASGDRWIRRGPRALGSRYFLAACQAIPAAYRNGGPWRSAAPDGQATQAPLLCSGPDSSGIVPWIHAPSQLPRSFA